MSMWVLILSFFHPTCRSPRPFSYIFSSIRFRCVRGTCSTDREAARSDGTLSERRNQAAAARGGSQRAPAGQLFGSGRLARHPRRPAQPHTGTSESPKASSEGESLSFGFVVLHFMIFYVYVYVGTYSLLFSPYMPLTPSILIHFFINSLQVRQGYLLH